MEISIDIFDSELVLLPTFAIGKDTEDGRWYGYIAFLVLGLEVKL